MYSMDENIMPEEGHKKTGLISNFVAASGHVVVAVPVAVRRGLSNAFGVAVEGTVKSVALAVVLLDDARRAWKKPKQSL